MATAEPAHRRLWKPVVGLVLGGLLFWIMYRSSAQETIPRSAPAVSITQPPVTVSPQPAAPPAPVAPPEEVGPADDPEQAKLVVGEWQDEFRGKRSLTVRADGTASMVSEPEGLGATLIAPRLQFNIQWTLRKNILSFETTGGEPESKVKMVLRMFGSKRTHEVLSLTEQEMQLLDEDGVTKYTWRRVETPDPAPME